MFLPPSGCRCYGEAWVYQLVSKANKGSWLRVNVSGAAPIHRCVDPNHRLRGGAYSQLTWPIHRLRIGAHSRVTWPIHRLRMGAHSQVTWPIHRYRQTIVRDDSDGSLALLLFAALVLGVEGAGAVLASPMLASRSVIAFHRFRQALVCDTGDLLLPFRRGILPLFLLGGKGGVRLASLTHIFPLLHDANDRGSLSQVPSSPRA
jgi:hypothetical protein